MTTWPSNVPVWKIWMLALYPKGDCDKIKVAIIRLCVVDETFVLHYTICEGGIIL